MKFEREISERFPGLTYERNFRFSRHTTIGCGGTAPLCVYPPDAESAARLLYFFKREGIPHFILGAGANVLPCEGEYEGVVVKLSALSNLEREGEFIRAGAGVTGGRLLRFARENALSGLEALTGIPMTVGGGCAMNAGVSEMHFSDVVWEVTAAEDGILRKFSAAECAFSKKESVFLSGITVTEVCFRLTSSDSRKIEERENFFRERRRDLPKGRSMGCVFVNPEVMPAGMLIERCGLKGRRCGGAYVSPEHANFIINEGGTAGDVAALVDIVKEEVKERTGITLKEEIRRIQAP